MNYFQRYEISTSSEARPPCPTVGFGWMSQGPTFQPAGGPFQGHFWEEHSLAGFSIEWKFRLQFPAINYAHVLSQSITRYYSIPPSCLISQYPDWCYRALRQERFPLNHLSKVISILTFSLSLITQPKSSKFMPAFKKVALSGFFGAWRARKKHCCCLFQAPHFAYEEMERQRGQRGTLCHLHLLVIAVCLV